MSCIVRNDGLSHGVWVVKHRFFLLSVSRWSSPQALQELSLALTAILFSGGSSTLRDTHKHCLSELHEPPLLPRSLNISLPPCT
jgi:hypothetical protein